MSSNFDSTKKSLSYRIKMSFISRCLRLSETLRPSLYRSDRVVCTPVYYSGWNSSVHHCRRLSSSTADDLDFPFPTIKTKVRWGRNKIRHDVWNIRYEELKKYIAEHGNSYVPRSYAPLGHWVNNQRKYLAKYLGGMDDESSQSITDDEFISLERIEKLKEIGFAWNAHEARFFQKLHELKLYKKNHGDTLVPRYYTENPALGHWVHDRRIEYGYYHKKKALEEKWGDVEVLDDDVAQELERLTKFVKGLTEERIQLLEAEDFIWDVPAYIWEVRLQELRSFMEVYGHAPVFSKKNYDPLANWVNLQRMYYRKYLKGQLTKMTEEKIAMLNSIGFQWHQPRVKRRSQTRRAATT